MQVKASVFFLGVLSAGILSAQSGTQSNPAQSSDTSAQTPPPAQSGSATPPAQTGTSSSSAESKAVYVHRFSVGATLTFLGLNSVTGGSNTVTTSAALSTAYNTTGASTRLGYGVTAQMVLTNHFAVTLGAFLRRIGYQFTTSVTTTAADNFGGTISSTTTTHEDTRARVIEIPVLLRYYAKSRHEKGGRWFAEGGAAWREINNSRSSVDTTDINGVLTCCTSIPTLIAHRNSKGIVGGAGLQLIDPLGIRVVPEFRYTHWLDPIFNNQTTHMQSNQVEASLSLTF